MAEEVDWIKAIEEQEQRQLRKKVRYALAKAIFKHLHSHTDERISSNKRQTTC